MKCFNPLCGQSPVLLCMCSGSPELMCQSDISQHSVKHPLSSHKYRHIYKSLQEDSKEAIKHKIHSLLSSFKENQKSIITKLSSISAVGNLILRDIQLKINHCNSVLESMYLLGKVPIINRNCEDLSDCATEAEIDHEIERLNEDTYKSLTSEHKVYKDVLTAEVGDYKLVRDLDFEQYSNLYMFNENSVELLDYNITSSSLKTLKIKINKPQGQLAAICQISDTEIFVSGGRSSAGVLNNAFIVDLTNQTVEILPNDRSRFKASSLVHDNKVYIFGGCNPGLFLSGLLRNADCFNLESRLWNALADLPQSINNTSSIIYNKNTIVISGKKSNLLTYSIADNVYELLSQRLEVSKSILVKDGNKVVLISDDTYLFDVEQKMCCLIRGSGKRLEKSTCSAIVRGRCAYFITAKASIFKFNLDFYTLNLL